MGRVIRLVVVALVLYGCWHAVRAQWEYLQFKDAVDQIAQFGVDKDPDDIRASVLSAGTKLGIPLAPERVAVRKESDHLYIDVVYTRPVEILPRYMYPWTFTVNAHGWFVPGGQIRK